MPFRMEDFFVILQSIDFYRLLLGALISVLALVIAFQMLSSKHSKLPPRRWSLPFIGDVKAMIDSGNLPFFWDRCGGMECAIGCVDSIDGSLTSINRIPWLNMAVQPGCLRHLDLDPSLICAETEQVFSTGQYFWGEDHGNTGTKIIVFKARSRRCATQAIFQLHA